MIADQNRCTGCYACFLACRDEYVDVDHLPYSAAQPNTGQYWMRIIERERGTFPHVKMSYLRVPCMHCDNPPCVKNSPKGAVYKREDGIVIIDPEKAQGHPEIALTCPYDVIFWNEALALPQKCTFCAHMIDEGEAEPRCVEACPTQALIFGDLDDPESDLSKRLAKEKGEYLHPEYGLGEKVIYLGLPKRFIAGTVIFGDTDKCGKGVHVTVSADGESYTTVTDNFGEFEVEGLKEYTDYTIKLEAPSYQTTELSARTRVDVYLGDIVLDGMLNKKGESL
jgi:Fe-S-cluster-containing dehydrogenase component